jgi:hypothetical protein
MMQSFNDKCRNAVYLASLRENDPQAFDSRSYLLRGTSLADEVICSFENDCRIGERLGKGEMIEKKDESGNIYESPLSYSWAFCFSCNSVAHLYCMGYSTRLFTEMELNAPFRCRKCISDPNNEKAKAFFIDQDHLDEKVGHRRDMFLKSIDLSETVLDENEKEAIEALKHKYESKLNELSMRYDRAERKLKEFEQMEREFQVMREQFRVSSDSSTGNVKGAVMSRPISNQESIKPLVKHVNGVSVPDQGSNPGPSRLSRCVNPSVGLKAPVPKPRKSFIDSLDVNELSKNERINLEQAQAQMEATEAQLEIASTHHLSTIRKALPEIINCDGDARKWIRFKRDVERYQNVGKYDSYEMRIYVLRALEGLARSRVEGSIDNVPFEVTMNVLRKCFGNPTRIIEQYARDILSIRVPKELCKDDVLMINSKILDYFGACAYADIDVPNSNQLAMHIFDQLNILHKQMFRHKFKECRVVELESVFSFLEDLSEELEGKNLKADVRSVNAISESEDSESGTRQPDDFMFEITDGNVNSHGYDLIELEKLNKFCKCCSMSEHYTLQCRKYRSMDVIERLKFVNWNKICRNCIITSSHRSSDCNLTGICGFKENNRKCFHRHHISLHKAFYKGNSNTYEQNKESDDDDDDERRSHRSLKPNNMKLNDEKVESNESEAENDSNKELNSDDEKSNDSQSSDVVLKDLVFQSLIIMQTGLPVATYTASSCKSTAVCNHIMVDMKHIVVWLSFSHILCYIELISRLKVLTIGVRMSDGLFDPGGFVSWVVI